MDTYTRFTKLTTLKDGTQAIQCSFHGNDVCRENIHKGGCVNCPIMQAMLNQLFEFENVLQEADD